MGMYRYISEQETRNMKTVYDTELNDLLQQALKYNDTLLIEENYFYRRKKGYKGWLLGEKEKYFEYQVYHESRAYDGRAHQALYYNLGSTKRMVMVYLHGIINGGLGYQHIHERQFKDSN